MKLKLLALIPLIFVTVGCLQTTPQTVVISDYCDNSQALSFSAANDSLQTINEIRRHNAVFKQLCL
jgi:hypothetical protein